MKLSLKEWMAKISQTTLIGEIKCYAGSDEPEGWMKCDGSDVSRTKYRRLFEVIGTTYGSGDGSTTFNLPDMRGRVPTGVGACDGVTYNLGDKKNAGVPNITGTLRTGWGDASGSGIILDKRSGAIKLYRDGTAYWSRGDVYGDVYHNNSFEFNAQDSDSHYGASPTVQPNTTVTNFLIYVGGVLRNSLIAILTAISKIGGGVDEYERKGVARESNEQGKGSVRVSRESNEQGKGSVRLAVTAACRTFRVSRYGNQCSKLYNAEAIQKIADNTADMEYGELHGIRLLFEGDRSKSVVIHSAEFYQSGRRVCTYKRHCPIELVDIPHGLAISERGCA